MAHSLHVAQPSLWLLHQPMGSAPASRHHNPQGNGQVEKDGKGCEEVSQKIFKSVFGSSICYLMKSNIKVKCSTVLFLFLFCIYVLV